MYRGEDAYSAVVRMKVSFVEAYYWKADWKGKVQKEKLHQQLGGSQGVDSGCVSQHQELPGTEVLRKEATRAAVLISNYQKQCQKFLYRENNRIKNMGLLFGDPK